MKTFNLKLFLVTSLTILSGIFSLHAADLTWDADPTFFLGPQDGPGIWNTTSWWNGVGDTIWNSATPDNATFGAGSGAAGSVTNNLPITVGNLTYNPASSGSYTNVALAANTISLAGSIITNNADGYLNVVLAGTGFTKEGANALFLRPPANNTYSGTTIVNHGRLVLNSSASGMILIPGSLTINSGGAVTNTGSPAPIANTGTVTVNAGGTYHGGFDDLNTLLLNGGMVIQNAAEQLFINNLDARSGAIVESAGATGILNGNLTKTTTGSVTNFAKGSLASTGLTNTIVSAGNLILDYTQNSSKLADSGSLTVNGGTLVFANGSHIEAVASVILASGIITNSSGATRLSIAAPNIYDVRTGGVFTVFAGTAGLTKSTPGTVILGFDNTYSGGTLISGGTLQVGNGGAFGLAGPVNVNITNNGTLVFNRSTSPGNISGAISGSGSVVNIGSGTIPFTGVDTYSGSTTISNGAISINGTSSLGDGTGALNLSGGTLNTTASRSISANPVANPVNLTVDSAITTSSTAGTVELNFNSDSVTGTAGTLTFSNAATTTAGQFEPRFSGSGFTFTRPIVIANGPNGTTRLNSYNTNGTTQTFNGVISGNGKFRRSHAAIGGVTILNATNTYSGDTINTGGTLLINGVIGSGNVTNGSGGLLGGNGIINGSVLVQSGGALSPGTGIGMLTISNSLTLLSGSTCLMQLDAATPTNDSVRGITTVTYAGTLTVANLSGTLGANDTFKLFDADTFTGSFSATNLPALGSGLVWDVSGLTNNGTIKVVSTAVISPTLNVAQSGSTLTFSWTGTFKLQSQTNTLAIGLLTNSASWFDYPGGTVSGVTATINPADPTVFFRLTQ